MDDDSVAVGSRLAGVISDPNFHSIETFAMAPTLKTT